jgi:hypothetical protein
LADAGAIDIDVQLRRTAGLLDAGVGQARNGRDLREQLLRIGAVCLRILARDLDVDRRGRAEVQDLAGDVGGQEGEGRAGKRRGSSRRSCETNSSVGR